MIKQEIESLISEFTCDDVIRCQNARRSLVAMGSKAVPPLVNALSNKKHWVRWEAAKALSQIGDPIATRALIKALEDKEFDVRWLAAEGLIVIGKDVLVPLLQILIDKPKSVRLREGAHHVLHDMDRDNLDGILRPLMGALESRIPTLEVPVAARKALDIMMNI